MTLVTLGPQELYFAAQHATMRRLNNLKAARAPRHGIADAHAWAADIDGAFGELALAKWLGVYWVPGVARPEYSGDVARYEVRATRHATGCLLLHPDDHDDRPYVLALIAEPTVTLAGWVMGQQGKSPAHWTSSTDTRFREPCFAVPQSALRPMSEMPSTFRTQRDAA